MSSEVGKIFGIKHFGHVYKLKNNWEEEKRNFKIHAQCSQSCPTLCIPVDRSLPDSSAHGIFQARILEWGAISHYRDLPSPGIEPTSLCLLYGQADSLALTPPEMSIRYMREDKL